MVIKGNNMNWSENGRKEIIEHALLAIYMRKNRKRKIDEVPINSDHTDRSFFRK